MNELDIYTDGGARGNPGPGSCAYVVFKNGKHYFESSKYLGKVTNNIAEYSAVQLAMVWLAEYFTQNEVNQVNFFLDSELVCKQLNREYKIKNENLRKIYEDIVRISSALKIKFIFNLIPRKENKSADFLVNKETDNNI